MFFPFFRPRPLTDPPPVCRYPHVPTLKTEDEVPSVQSFLGLGVEADQVPSLQKPDYSLIYGPNYYRDLAGEMAARSARKEPPKATPLTLEDLEEYTRVRSTHPRDGWVLTDSHFLDALVAEALASRREKALLSSTLEAFKVPRPLEVGDFVEGWGEGWVNKLRGALTVHIPGAIMSVIDNAEVKEGSGRWTHLYGPRRVHTQGLFRHTSRTGR